MEYYLVDAFSKVPFAGNPAAVCLPEKEIDAVLMQQIAMEMNQSETAFLIPLEGRKTPQASLFSLRWFTPRQEVDLCGHATLASAKVLFELQRGRHPELAFETRSGVLKVSCAADSLIMQLPINEPKSFFANVSLKRALGVEEIVNVMWDEKLGYLLVHLPREEDVARIDPDFGALLGLDLDFDVKGLIVTAKGGADCDFVSRFFAPWLGINEDPVTGSSHTVLYPYWENITGRFEMRARQLSRRGGEMQLRRHGADCFEIQGQAVIVAQGQICVEH